MSNKLYFYLLIVSGFLCPGIIASLSANNTRKSADFLVRHRRVINHEPDGHSAVKIEDVNYIVNIRYNRGLHCVGAILSRFTVITAATCVIEVPLGQYQVQSGSGYSHRSVNHSITTKAVHYGNRPYGLYDGIALLKVNPPFIFGSNTGNITLHIEPVVTGTMALVSGWGLNHPTSQSMTGKQRLRSITLPIMNHRACIATYAGHFQITNKHICTYDERKLCANHDIGTPLVINSAIVGIHIYKGCFPGHRNADVFIDVQLQEYSGWIKEHIIL